MPLSEDDEVFGKMDSNTNSVKCDLCGGKMYRAGGCYLCIKCGQKKCNTDIT